MGRDRAGEPQPRWCDPGLGLRFLEITDPLHDLLNAIEAIGADALDHALDDEPAIRSPWNTGV